VALDCISRNLFRSVKHSFAAPKRAYSCVGADGKRLLKDGRRAVMLAALKEITT